MKLLPLSENPIDPEYGEWSMTTRDFLWEKQTDVSSAAFNKMVGLLVVGFTSGVFGLYELPGCNSIHRLSVSHSSLNTCCLNNTGGR